MENKQVPQPPKLFMCNKCQVYFYTWSEMKKPTHPRCKGHNVREATPQEIEWVKKVNGM